MTASGTRWLSEAEVLQYTGLKRTTFRRHLLPHLTPVKYTKRIVRYDRDEIDRRLAAQRGESAPSTDEDRVLERLYENDGARR